MMRSWSNTNHERKANLKNVSGYFKIIIKMIDIRLALVDHFKSSADSHSSKISPFADFDHPADSGHNSFKPKIHPQIVHSKFAPMDTPVELGHNDIQQQPPFFGKMEPEEIEEPSSYSVLVPSNRIRPSFAEHSHHSDPEPSYAASMDKPHDEQFGYEERKCLLNYQNKFSLFSRG
jgi:hypothetical protein